MRKYAGYSRVAPDFRLRIRRRFLQTSHTMSHTGAGRTPAFPAAKIREWAGERYHGNGRSTPCAGLRQVDCSDSASARGELLSIVDFFHETATGPKHRRALLTPVGLLAFGSSLFVVIAGGLIADRALGLPRLFPGKLGLAIGGPFFMLGALLCSWCVARFRKARGTPVPMNPPHELITSGPYAWVRNPMVTGVFAALFGLGLMLHSIGIAFIGTPAYALAHWIELKRVEEPELARRFGAEYLDYKERVPMFVPRLTRIPGRQAPSDTR